MQSDCTPFPWVSVLSVFKFIVGLNIQGCKTHYSQAIKPSSRPIVVDVVENMFIEGIGFVTVEKMFMNLHCLYKGRRVL
jgi:hypothetical protein